MRANVASSQKTCLDPSPRRLGWMPRQNASLEVVVALAYWRSIDLIIPPSTRSQDVTSQVWIIYQPDTRTYTQLLGLTPTQPTSRLFRPASRSSRLRRTEDTRTRPPAVVTPPLGWGARAVSATRCHGVDIAHLDAARERYELRLRVRASGDSLKLTEAASSPQPANSPSTPPRPPEARAPRPSAPCRRRR